MEFYSNGKLLISGEYFVLDGAKCLALPCKKGQLLKIKPNTFNENIIWESWDIKKNLWLSAEFDLLSLKILKGDKNSVELILLKKILIELKKLNPDCLKTPVIIITQLEFNLKWGLGSSSTLINNLAKWSKTDPYKLLSLTFGGSGYDIACANSNSSILYRKINNSITFSNAKFFPNFHQNLFFIYLNKKQNSKNEISRYLKLKKPLQEKINKISYLSEQMTLVENQEEFNEIILEHEKIISDHIGLNPIKKEFFQDFNGEIKSLGAWGGDFILASSNNKEEVKNYFKNQRLNTIIPFSELSI
ncbi:MAG: GYDIA family GHMP kinase [Flavobacteriaceae bacterium]|nr:GYDIA family GHMP kinase [Flavobacteriaceae bacterium]